MRLPAYAVPIILGSVSMVGPGNAQDSAAFKTLAESPDCEGCTIGVEFVANLHGGDEFGSLSTNFLVRDASGRYITSSIYSLSNLLLFRPDGEYDRLLGRSGGGPGEFQQIAFAAVGPGDSLHVFDTQAGSRTVYTPDLEFVRESAIGLSPSEGIVLTPDTTIIADVIGSRGHFGFAVHSVVADKLAEPLGEMESLGANGRPGTSMARSLASDMAGGFWAAHFQELVLDGFDPKGRQHSRITGRPPWFAASVPNQYSSILSPRLLAVQVGEDGNLWLVCRVPARDWRSTIEVKNDSPTPWGASVGSRTGNLDDLYDTILAVVNPVEGAILAAHRMNEMVRGFADRSHIYAFLDTPDGAGMLRVWRVQFLPSGSTRVQH